MSVTVTPLRGDVEKPIGYMSLEFSSEVQSRELGLGRETQKDKSSSNPSSAAHWRCMTLKELKTFLSVLVSLSVK